MSILCACRTQPASKDTCKEVRISTDTAILIAKGDAAENYTLDRYDITVTDEPEGWRIVFKLKNTHAFGGGPEYLVDKTTGKILKAKYEK